MFWLVSGGKVQPFDGDLEDYRQWRIAQLAEGGKPSDGDAQGVNRKEQKRQEAEARQQLAKQRKPLQTRLSKLEQEMNKLSDEKAQLEAFMSSSEAYDDANRQKLADSVKRQGEVATRLEIVEEEWMEVQEQLEALAQAD